MDPNSPLPDIEQIIETLEILKTAVFAGNGEKGYEAVTVLLLQFIETFGHDQSFMRKTFPLLDEMKNCVQAGNFEDAVPMVLGFLAKFRAIRDVIVATGAYKGNGR